MLVLTRSRSEQIVCDVPPSSVAQRIVITMVEIRGERARLGVDAPFNVAIRRAELPEREIPRRKRQLVEA